MSALSNFSTVLAASTVTTVGATIVVLIVLGLLVYVWVNLREGRAEIGSEVELAPNRKPYYDDDELETTVLNRTLRWALVLLVIIAVGLPLYWLNEPARMEGAVENFDSTFVHRGETQYVEGSQCQNCHGPEGTGGQASTTIFDAEGEFLATINWRAPALDTVLLRFSREEVEYIINYGRPGTPMPGWGAEVGKGPLSPQQVRDLIYYLDSIQLSSDEAKLEAETALATQLGLVEEGASEDEIDEAIASIDYEDEATGEAAFNLEAASGAFACARCHTRGWSIITEGDDAVTPADADLSYHTPFPDGSGAFGPNLTGGIVPREFATFEELVAFITIGSIDGEPYGNNNQGRGGMPGFGDNPNTEEVEGDGMLPPEYIAAIARYVGGLPPADTPSAPAPSVAELTAEDEEG
ncbi:MAG: c-type cytochrome [Acidimicrobiales bacterium]|nr:c-type cytochrome [Acidimicrobiales bacterium]